MPKIYTLGYAAKGADEVLSELMADRSVLLVDICLRPLSRSRPAYRHEALQERFGVFQYHSVPQLGNINDRDRSLPFVLDAPLTGLALLAYWLEHHYSVCLLCACADVVSCHRSLVARLAAGRCACEVVHL